MQDLESRLCGYSGESQTCESVCSEIKLFLILLWTRSSGSLTWPERPEEVLEIKEPGWQVIILLWKRQC